MTRIKLSDERVKEIYENKVRNLAYHLWEQAGRPDNKSDEFWFEAKDNIDNQNYNFSKTLESSALPEPFTKDARCLH